ncbi:MAG: hypothetical protein RBT80_09400 [Candidatus Vecturithrix sp.]|jgi:hypothetical protein|nr:hypothetical protein [Candidatus Vecturithrix sp.]
MDPYANKMFSNDPYYQKIDLVSHVVAILDAAVEKRGLEIIQPPTRVVNKDEVHELILTDQTTLAEDRRVDRIAYLAFVCFENSGVLQRGDKLMLGDVEIGTILGFDEAHMPNHQNIVLQTNTLQTGREWGLNLHAQLVFHKPD